MSFDASTYCPDLAAYRNSSTPFTCPLCGNETMMVYYMAVMGFDTFFCWSCWFSGDASRLHAAVTSRSPQRVRLEYDGPSSRLDAADAVYTRQDRIAKWLLRGKENLSADLGTAEALLNYHGLRINLKSNLTVRRNLFLVRREDELGREWLPSNSEQCWVMLPLSLIPGIVASFIFIGETITQTNLKLSIFSAANKYYRPTGKLDFSWGQATTALVVSDPLLALRLVTIHQGFSSSLNSPVVLADTKACFSWGDRLWEDLVFFIQNAIPRCFSLLHPKRYFRLYHSAAGELTARLTGRGGRSWLAEIVEESQDICTFVRALVRQKKYSLLRQLWDCGMSRHELTRIAAGLDPGDRARLEDTWGIDTENEIVIRSRILSRKEEGGFRFISRKGKEKTESDVDFRVHHCLMGDPIYYCGDLRFRGQDTPFKIAEGEQFFSGIRQCLIEAGFTEAPYLPPARNRSSMWDWCLLMSDFDTVQGWEKMGLKDDCFIFPGLVVTESDYTREDRLLCDTQGDFHPTVTVGEGLKSAACDRQTPLWLAACGFLIPLLSSLFTSSPTATLFVGWHRKKRGKRLLDAVGEALDIGHNYPGYPRFSKEIEPLAFLHAHLEAAHYLDIFHDLHFVVAPRTPILEFPDPEFFRHLCVVLVQEYLKREEETPSRECYCEGIIDLLMETLETAYGVSIPNVDRVCAQIRCRALIRPLLRPGVVHRGARLLGALHYYNEMTDRVEVLEDKVKINLQEFYLHARRTLSEWEDTYQRKLIPDTVRLIEYLKEDGFYLGAREKTVFLDRDGWEMVGRLWTSAVLQDVRCQTPQRSS